ncbi:UTRA domain-containing protein [Pseudomonas fakonensis]|uniref:UTRA domain-containing protein n=1 Tax=Pseudomonas fakonensis TaxID=2842355 RepID=A0ABX8NEE6_9PSED|nr:UTRA domain-containing protein [Pseudomonas fakonensis]
MVVGHAAGGVDHLEGHLTAKCRGQAHHHGFGNDQALGHVEAAVNFGRAIAVVDQQVRAVLLPVELARELKAEAGSPGLKILRHYRDDDGQLMAVSETVHPDDRFTLVPQIHRDKAI